MTRPKYFHIVAMMFALIFVACDRSEDKQADLQAELQKAADKQRAEDLAAAGEPVQIMFIGPPGSGKGTQSVKVQEKYGVPHISTGAMLRQELAARTPLGLEAREYAMKGQLVPGDVVLRMVEKRLSQPDCRDGFILDGFPRNLTQAEGLEQILNKRPSNRLIVIHIAVPDEVLVERLIVRGRDDDTEASIINRIDIYYESTAPVISFYEDRQSIFHIDGNQSIDDVFKAIEKVLDENV